MLFIGNTYIGAILSTRTHGALDGTGSLVAPDGVTVESHNVDARWRSGTPRIRAVHTVGSTLVNLRTGVYGMQTWADPTALTVSMVCPD